MRSWRTLILIGVFAIGFFLLSVGGDSLKVAHHGIKFVPIVWLGTILPFSDHTIGVGLMVVGVCLIVIVQQVCRRDDKRAAAVEWETSESSSFGLVMIAGACIAFAGWWIADWWFRV